MACCYLGCRGLVGGRGCDFPWGSQQEPWEGALGGDGRVRGSSGKRRSLGLASSVSSRLALHPLTCPPGAKAAAPAPLPEQPCSVATFLPSCCLTTKATISEVSHAGGKQHFPFVKIHQCFNSLKEQNPDLCTLLIQTKKKSIGLQHPLGKHPHRLPWPEPFASLAKAVPDPFSSYLPTRLFLKTETPSQKGRAARWFLPYYGWASALNAALGAFGLLQPSIAFLGPNHSVV